MRRHLIGFILLAMSIPCLAVLQTVNSRPELANFPVKADTALTPGAALTTDINVICKVGYTKTVRNVPGNVKRKVFEAYHLTNIGRHRFEIDHLISLGLGGSNDISNLWPQSYETTPLNAHVKDTLENKLHRLVCQGGVPLEQVQKDVATDWTAAYVKYIGPLPH